MDNILYECFGCGKHNVIRNGYDGGTCRYCSGPLNPIGMTDKQETSEHFTPERNREMENEEEITILLTSADEPPKVLINGKRVPVQRLRIDYQTDTIIRGKHSFDLVYLDEKYRQRKSVGFSR